MVVMVMKMEMGNEETVSGASSPDDPRATLMTSAVSLIRPCPEAYTGCPAHAGPLALSSASSSSPLLSMREVPHSGVPHLCSPGQRLGWIRATASPLSRWVKARLPKETPS